MPDDFKLTPLRADQCAGRRHGIERVEWERRFRQYFGCALEWTDAQLDGIIEAELESWPEAGDTPESCDWRIETPEGAAAENLSNWTD